MRVLRTEAAGATAGPVDAEWTTKVEELSRLCEEGVSKTHIAFLGTTMLAKSVARGVDLFAIKPEHAPNNENAFSARSLCHGVIVPLAAELGINLGVTGREPLNNQPYFRMTRLDDGTPVHQGSRRAFDYMVALVRELQELPSEAGARQALRAFIAVRRRYLPRYALQEGEVALSPEQLVTAIKSLVRENSEGGRRAQAVVAGLFDVFATPGRVESGRINDPSRKYPGDVCVRAVDEPTRWEKAIEVRDKPMTAADVQIFGAKCVAMAVREAAVVMVAERQPPLDARSLVAWADEMGIGLTLFQGWDRFVDQALFWSGEPKPVAAGRAVNFIHKRLIAVEASPAALEAWQRLTQTV
jgi:hypothetical protein